MRWADLPHRPNMQAQSLVISVSARPRSSPDHRYFKKACAIGSIKASSALISRAEFSIRNWRNYRNLSITKTDVRLKTLINTVGFRLVLLFLFRYQSQLDTSWCLGFQLLHQRRRLAAVILGCGQECRCTWTTKAENWVNKTFRDR